MNEQLKCFVKEGDVYRWKGQKGFYYGLALFLFLIMIAGLFYGPNKGVRIIGVFVGLLGMAGLLRSTTSICIDTFNRRITNRSFFFGPERIFDFSEFDHFRIVKSRYMIMTINLTAFMIFNRNGKEKSIMLQQSLFSARPLQKLTEEIEQIMAAAEKSMLV